MLLGSINKERLYHYGNKTTLLSNYKHAPFRAVQACGAKLYEFTSSLLSQQCIGYKTGYGGNSKYCRHEEDDQLTLENSG